MAKDAEKINKGVCANSNYKYGVIKSLLIDLEAQKQGDRAELERDRERLSEENISNDVCDSLTMANS